ncbi:hypothetical protein JMJ35_008887 [Cladonia borealis]|uniref:Carboxypeptidase regulatory-like domain-containing protein n=1 Tax=Cladonia borealis TaxID=184061 RepID=A0AA39QVH4_9LECA|nr:hypothetical protein JMJ35_008887 [Cladonia borealis]
MSIFNSTIWQRSFRILSLLLLVLSAHAIRSSSPVVTGSLGHTVLRPINVNEYEIAIGLQRRGSEKFSDLSPQTQAELIYGSPADNGQLLLANMTLYATDGLLLVLMERFDSLTSSVDCDGDSGTISLTFNSQDAFNYALQEWNYINQNDDGQFLLIANHEGCGPDDERHPYLISTIAENSATLTTYLSAQPAPWSDVAGTYDLDFGQAVLVQQPQRLTKRGFWGDVVNVGKDVLDAATGSADLSKSVTFPVNAGQQGQRTSIYTNDAGSFTLDCINCFITGSFEVTGHISVQNFDLQDLTLTASPQGFQAELELEATITSTDEPDSLQYTKQLLSAPVPGAGISVSGIFNLGATLSYSVGVSSSFAGSATVDFGLRASLPDSAQLVANIQDPESSSATGFGGGSLTPLFDITKESASLTLSAFSQPELEFGIELIEIGKFDVGLTVKLPEVSVTLTAAYDQAGVCSQDPGASKTGVQLSSEVDIGVDLQIDASLGGNDSSKPSWSKTLFSISKPLFSDCYPLSIPGLDSDKKPSTTTSVSPSSTDSGGGGCRMVKRFGKRMLIC